MAREPDWPRVEPPLSPAAQSYLAVFDAWCKAGFEDAPEFVDAMKDNGMAELTGLDGGQTRRRVYRGVPHSGTDHLMRALTRLMERDEQDEQRAA